MVNADVGPQIMDGTFRFVVGGPSKWECLGKDLAFMQMHKVIFESFRKFDVTLVNPATTWKAASTRIWGIEDFNVQFTRREKGTVDPPRSSGWRKIQARVTATAQITRYGQLHSHIRTLSSRSGLTRLRFSLKTSMNTLSNATSMKELKMYREHLASRGML
ncbi:hypothetical protein E8E14_014757 [Neopestalotiopsis sp. 37M]|nr:hypothetical protein E8E14_014757 [Neopestalotiopsis sp. 37M]